MEDYQKRNQNGRRPEQLKMEDNQKIQMEDDQNDSKQKMTKKIENGR